jgi:hypothetical protein
MLLWCAGFAGIGGAFHHFAAPTAGAAQILVERQLRVDNAVQRPLPATGGPSRAVASDLRALFFPGEPARTPMSPAPGAQAGCATVASVAGPLVAATRELPTPTAQVR